MRAANVWLASWLLVGAAVLSAAPGHADTNICTATRDSPTCNFHCHDGDWISIVVSALGVVEGEVSCSTGSTSCLGVNQCSAQAGPVSGGATGTCTLDQGDEATCRNTKVPA